MYSSGGGGSTIPSEDMSYGVASGTNTYSVTLSPAITEYTTGLLISVKFTNSNTSSTVTLDCNLLGAKSIVGTNNVPLPIGQISANGTYYLLYDGTNLILQAGMMDRKDYSYYRKTGTDNIERWYTGSVGVITSTTLSGLGSGTLRAIPFAVTKTITLDRIAMEITAAGTGGSLLRLGIYSSVNALPYDLVLDAGTIAADSATFQSITIDQTLPPNLYWLTFIHNSASTITVRAMQAAVCANVLGVPSTLGTGTYQSYLASTFTFGALPNPFDYTSLAAVTANPFIISVRTSA